MLMDKGYNSHAGRSSPPGMPDRQEFHEKGFVVLPELLSSREVPGFRARTMKLFETRCGWENGDYIDMTSPAAAPTGRLLQIMYPSKYDPELGAHPVYDRALQIARHLIGVDAQLDFDHAMLKPARHGEITGWHQDEAYWDPNLDHNSISIWLALQETDLTNGCMHFISGSHKGSVLRHSQFGGDADVHAIEAQNVETSEARPCPVPAGSGTAHHQRLLHYAGPNLSDLPRLAFIYVFCRPPTAAATPQVYPWREALLNVRMHRERPKV